MPAFTEDDGHALAVNMLREINKHWLARRDSIDEGANVSDDELTAAMQTAWRSDRSEVLRRYLATVREANSPELEHGFLAVLTDVLGGVHDGEGCEVAWYEPEAAASGGRA